MKNIHTLDSIARERFRFSPLQYMLDAARDNPKLASVYADDDVSVCLFNHMLFIGGAYRADRFDFILTDILSGDFRANHPVFYVFCDRPEWEDAFAKRFGEKAHAYERSLFGIHPREQAVETPEEIQEIKDFMPYSNFEMIVDEVVGTATYDDMPDFFARGVCFAPVIDGAVSGFCTSEYPSAGALAIGIEVLEPFRKRGYAKAMTQAFLNRAAEKGVSVYWECWKDNAASANTARACGFGKIADYRVLVVELQG